MPSWLRRLFAPEAPPPAIAPPAAPPPAPAKAPEVELAESLAALRATLGAEESRLYRDARARMADDEQRLAEAREFVERTGLAVATLAILKEMWHWPSWLTKQPLAVHLDALGISEASGEEVKEGRRTTKRVRFTVEGHAHTLEFSHEPSDAIPGYHPGTLSLADGEAPVLRLAVTHNDERDYDTWKLSRVELVQPGPWMARVIELEHRVRVKQQDTQLASQTKYAADGARDLPAPGALRPPSQQTRR